MDIEKINDFIEAYSRAIQLSPEYTEVLKELLPKIIKKYSKIKLNFIDWLIIPIVCSIISYLVLCVSHFNLIDLKLNLICNILLFILIYLMIFIFLNQLRKRD